MNISPKQLRLFLVLSDTLNFSKAAELLFISQPALTKAIRELEESIGLTLFERTTRSVRLTPGGARMAVVARSVLGEFEAGLQRFQSSAEREAAQVSIAAWPSLAHVVLPSVCATLERQRPGVQITLMDAANSACIQRLLNHQADFALASVAPTHPELRYEELLRDRFVLLGCGKWRKRLAAPMRMDELLELPLITLTDASTAMRYMSAAYLQRGIEYRPKMQVDQATTVAGLIRKEVGIAVLPWLGVMPLLPMAGTQTAEIVDGPLRSVGIVTRRQGHPGALAQAAMEEVRAVSRELTGRYPGWILPPSARRR
ncbi:LysR family transcriptional regulator [uncultured Hydrogenophaga sp.]|uniref:LysR family transcriptional regulator n=1 Tax=uncultured Hydrogenophaga sp. TaxID=199683 RepID=UPI00265FE5CA|nr:LysR family transcriptional regulator [uncultured Hydrogenophaga sp.]